MAYLLEILPFCKIEHLSYRINIDIEMVYYEPNKHTIQLISSSGRIVLGLSIEARKPVLWVGGNPFLPASEHSLQPGLG